jgi:hypothetical protein
LQIADHESGSLVDECCDGFVVREEIGMVQDRCARQRLIDKIAWRLQST